MGLNGGHTTIGWRIHLPFGSSVGQWIPPRNGLYRSGGRNRCQLANPEQDDVCLLEEGSWKVRSGKLCGGQYEAIKTAEYF